MNSTLENIDNCECAMDDIFLYGKSKQDLQNMTQLVLQRLKSTGFTLNQEKSEFNKSKVKFLGHIFTENG